MDILSFLVIVAEIVFSTLFIYNDKKYHDNKSIILKTLASLMFVLLAIIRYRTKGLLIVIALCFDMLGDFVLILRNKHKEIRDLIFVSGTLLFFIAHILFSTYLISLNTNHLSQGIILCTFLYICIFFALGKKLNVKGKIKVLGCCYSYLILLTCSFALVNYLNLKTTYNLVLMIGLIIFALSDLSLMTYKFAKPNDKTLQIIYRILYYVSQLIIAFYIGLL